MTHKAKSEVEPIQEVHTPPMTFREWVYTVAAAVILAAWALAEMMLR
jgi:hypothetical protein